MTSSTTKVFGLIGDPIDKSISHEIHNVVMRDIGWNALYLKLPIKKDELAEMISLAKERVMVGLSVTQPLKEEVIQYLDEIDPLAQKIGAVNTLSFKEGKVFGTNTDGWGALQAIEEVTSVKGKHLVILGAGGAVKAVAYTAREHGANVTILNRTPERARALANSLDCSWGSLEEVPEQYDILINGTPHPMPIEEKAILSNVVAMDLKNQREQFEFLQVAKEKGCQVIPGQKMFLYQAIGQYRVWNDGSLDLDQVEKILTREVWKVYS